MDSGEDCPHRQQLEDTLLHCQTQKEILQVTRDNYLSIIDEFKRDLEELTVQVEQQQQQQQPQQEQLKPQDSPCAEPTHIILEEQNNRLACEIGNLKDTLRDRDNQVKQLHDMISGSNDIPETNRLRNEILDLKQKNFVQSRIVRKTTDQLKEQEDNHDKLCDKYKSLLENYEEQCKELKRSNNRASTLQGRISQVEKLQEELRTERNILREEVISLKEKDAKRNGRERALCDQLKCSRLEIERSRSLIQRMQCHLKQEEHHHHDTVKKLEFANDDIRHQMRNIADECKQMQVKLKKQIDVNQQLQKIIDSFSKWKDAQIRSDEAMRQCVKGGEDNINMLLEENQSLSDQYRKLHRDYSLLANEMETVKKAVNKRGSYQQQQQPQINPNELADNNMAKCVQNLSNASRRIAHLNDYTLLRMQQRATGDVQQDQQRSYSSDTSRTGATQFSDILPIA